MPAIDRMAGFFAGMEKLRGFKTADEIAAFLGSMGYKGRSGHGGDCVVARFIKDCAGDPEAKVSVSTISVGYKWTEAGEENYAETVVKDPHALEDFLNEFDAHMFPELIEPGPATRG